MNFYLPSPIKFNEHTMGQAQFTIQCLYLAKAFGDEYTLNTDMDEFVVFHNNLTIYDNLKYKYYSDISNTCWTVFDSYDVWKLTDPSSRYMVPRYSEINVHTNGGKTEHAGRCKTLWNNKLLWNAEVHGGGACSLDKPFEFKSVRNFMGWWRNRDIIDNKWVRLMDIKYEAGIRHYINALSVRLPFVTKKFSVNDSCAINKIIWDNVLRELNSLNDTDYKYLGLNDGDNDTKKFDVVQSNNYIKLYGGSDKAMNPINETQIEGKRYKETDLVWKPVYDSSLQC